MWFKNKNALNEMLERLSMMKLGIFDNENQIYFGWVNLSLIKTWLCVFVQVLIEYIVEKYDDWKKSLFNSALKYQRYSDFSF